MCRTGGASGIGAATARRFVAEGASVCILDRDVAAAEPLQRNLGQTILRWSSMCGEDSGRACRSQGARALGSLDVLVNNAGAELNEAYDETTVDEWNKVLDTDLKAPGCCANTLFRAW